MALQHGKELKLKAQTIRADGFPLDLLKSKFERIAGELEQGCGFVRLTGLPVDRWQREDLELIWMGLASYLGQPVYQNSEGQLLREIRAETGDVGQRHGQLATGSGQFLSSRANRIECRATLPYRPHRYCRLALYRDRDARRQE